jgi:hypothetical protein
MMSTQGERGVLFRVVGFYVGPVVLLILVSGGALSLCLSGLYPIPAVLAGVVTIAIAALVGREMPRKTENTADLAVTLARTRTGRRQRRSGSVQPTGAPKRTRTAGEGG